MLVKNYVKRDIEEKVWKYMEDPEILAVVGPRQSGKTTLIRKIEENLENSNFVTFEDRDVLRLFEEDEKEFAEMYLEDFDYLLIDEVQYAEEGGRKLKYLYDTYPDKKIIITGSSSMEMTLKGLKYLTGRVLKFELFPFSFREFLRYRDNKLFKIFSDRETKIKEWLKGEKLSLSESVLERLEKLRKEYVVYGGYPRVVLADKDSKKEKILENIVHTYLIKEIGRVLGVEDEKEFEDLMKLLSVQMGEKMNYSRISKKTGINHRKLKKYIDVLEKTFVLEQIRPFYSNKTKEITKSPKLYFYDNGFRNSLINSFQKPEFRSDVGNLNENFFFSQSRSELKYWRTKSGAEMDFVFDGRSPVPFEIKTSPKITRSFRSFLDKYSPEKSFIMNETEFRRDENIFYLPLIFSEKILNLTG